MPREEQFDKLQKLPGTAKSRFSTKDYSDHMALLSRGFKDQIYDIFQLLPPKGLVEWTVMAGAAPEGTQFDACQFDAKMQELLGTEGGDDFFTSYDEVYDSFDAMGLQENLLRDMYAYGF